MGSLRTRLLIGTSVGIAVVLLVMGLLLHVLVRKSLVEQFDGALLDEARMLASTVEFEDGGVVLDFAELDLLSLKESARPAYLQIWLGEDRVIYRSPALGLGNLLNPSGPRISEGFLWVELPDGAHGRSVGITFRPRQDPDEEDEAEAGEGESEGADEEDVVRFAEIPLVTLVLARHTEPIDQALARLLARLSLVGLLALLVSVAVLSLVIHRSLRPLNRLAGRIGMLDEKNLSGGLAEHAGPREVQPIIDQLNNLLDRLDRAFDRERSFSANMAHELRTPLSGLRAIIDVVLARPRAGNDYREGLEECLPITLQMQEMVSRLLYQARLESGQVDMQPEPLQINRLVRSTWGTLEDRAAQRGLEVQWSLGDNDILITDAALFGLVMHNILGNAVEHADDRGTVRIETAFNGSAPSISVANSGSRVPSASAERVFERFWRGDESRSSGRGHSGLGLTLVKRAVTMMGGQVVAVSEAGGEFVITVTLPPPDLDSLTDEI